jgi:hypothetical protein
MEGADQNRGDPVRTRPASYSQLGQGACRCRTRTISVGAVGLTALLLLHLRTIRLSQQLSPQFQEQLAERTRIAQGITGLGSVA